MSVGFGASAFDVFRRDFEPETEPDRLSAGIGETYNGNIN